MFEVLEPTDIVVVGREPASVRTIDSKGKPSRDSCLAHDDGHRDTVLRVWTESDTIEYQCEEKFEIMKVEKAGWKIYDTPDNPFEQWEPRLTSQGNAACQRRKTVMGLEVGRPDSEG